MIRNLEIVNYQRNGICGIGFFTACFTNELGIRLMATFEADDETGLIKEETCRVNQRDDLRTSWRGDEYAHDINLEMWKRKTMVLDACQLYQSYEKPSVIANNQEISGANLEEPHAS